MIEVSNILEKVAKFYYEHIVVSRSFVHIDG
jgi:hypothetical protein